MRDPTDQKWSNGAQEWLGVQFPRVLPRQPDAMGRCTVHGLALTIGEQVDYAIDPGWREYSTVQVLLAPHTNEYIRPGSVTFSTPAYRSGKLLVRFCAGCREEAAFWESSVPRAR